MMNELHPILQLAVLVLGPTGAAWIGVKAALNGVKADVREVKEDLRAFNIALQETRERLARLEVEVGK